jgi:G:T-mismatch repair DNA endonuclease (very short patch repair protein)
MSDVLTTQKRAEVRAAVAANPTAMTLQLAHHLVQRGKRVYPPSHGVNKTTPEKIAQPLLRWAGP